jgi:opacity protein-like surface antigen
MKRMILIVVTVASLAGGALSQDLESSVIDSVSRVLEERHDFLSRTGTGGIGIILRRFGLSVQSGLLKGDNLAMSEGDNNPYWLLGLPFGVGAYFVISENAITGIDVVYTKFPDFIRLWGPTTTISRLEFGAHLKYIFRPYAGKSLYGKLGLKVARLTASCRPGKGLFGGTVGTNRKTKTEYAPGGELAVGFIKAMPGHTAVFIEATFGHLYMEGKNVIANDPAAEWKYPRDLIAFGVRFGFMAKFLGRKNEF